MPEQPPTREPRAASVPTALGGSGRCDRLIGDLDVVLLQPLTADLAYVAQAVVSGHEVLTPRPRAHSLGCEAVALAHP